MTALDKLKLLAKDLKIEFPRNRPVYVFFDLYHPEEQRI